MRVRHGVSEKKNSRKQIRTPRGGREESQDKEWQGAKDMDFISKERFRFAVNP